ncbi:MAG: oleate hydratase [Methanoregula sp.]|nr:oleate hydratase [Methanoregula sp.]
MGGGIASLASATYLIRDVHLPGSMITILEELDRNVGILDGKGLTGGRLPHAGAGCLRSIMAAPSL